MNIGTIIRLGSEKRQLRHCLSMWLTKLGEHLHVNEVYVFAEIFVRETVCQSSTGFAKGCLRSWARRVPNLSNTLVTVLEGANLYFHKVLSLALNLLHLLNANTKPIIVCISEKENIILKMF